MKYIFLALFCLFSAAHLYGSYIDNKKIRAFTKGFILLSLMSYYIASAETVQIIVVAALGFSFIGDILLQVKKLFVLGGLSFAFAHICFVIYFARNTEFSRVPFWLYVIALITYAAVIIVMGGKVRNFTSKAFIVAMVGYLIALVSTTAFASFFFWYEPGFATLIIFVGALFFLASDIMLLCLKLVPGANIWKKHFSVMLTYIIAEFLIISGILLH